MGESVASDPVSRPYLEEPGVGMLALLVGQQMALEGLPDRLVFLLALELTPNLFLGRAPLRFLTMKTT